MRRASLIIAAGLSLGLTTQVQAFQETTEDAIAKAELRKKQADAEAAEHEAEKQKYEKRKAAAEAKFGFLPKSPGDGSTELGTGGGELEADLLVADAIGSAADYIADAIGNGRAGILLVNGSTASGNARLMGFKAEVYATKRSAGRALGVNSDLCPATSPPKSPNNNAAHFVGSPLPAAGSLIGALSDMLKTETKVSGNTSSLGADHLVRALLMARPAIFRTSFFDGGVIDPSNDVIVDLDCLSRIDQMILAELSRYATDDDKKSNAAKISRLTAAQATLDGLLDRLLKVDDESPSLLSLLYADAEISQKSNHVLRVWVDAPGGTFVTRKNLWTTLGARSLAITGGAVVSYLLVDRVNGTVAAAGMLKCTTDMVSLRRAHKPGLRTGNCAPLVESRR